MEALKRHIKDRDRGGETSLMKGNFTDSYDREFDFIKDKPHLIFILKKIEKLSSVCHVLTTSLPADEPIRRLLREETILLFKDAFSLEWNSPSGKRLEPRIAACVSLLDLAKNALVISEMNARVVIHEFQKLLDAVSFSYEHEREKLSFEPKAIVDETDDYKGHIGQNNVFYNKKIPALKKESLKKDSNQKDSDSTREKMIMEIIKTKGDVSIKDISFLVKGVSSKTIQRDLIRLVGKGVLEKSGERRWSRYSIK